MAWDTTPLLGRNVTIEDEIWDFSWMESKIGLSTLNLIKIIWRLSCFKHVSLPHDYPCTTSWWGRYREDISPHYGMNGTLQKNHKQNSLLIQQACIKWKVKIFKCYKIFPFHINAIPMIFLFIKESWKNIKHGFHKNIKQHCFQHS